jgi:hypothetical protein
MCSSDGFIWDKSLLILNSACHKNRAVVAENKIQKPGAYRISFYNFNSDKKASPLF